MSSGYVHENIVETGIQHKAAITITEPVDAIYEHNTETPSLIPRPSQNAYEGLGTRLKDTKLPTQHPELVYQVSNEATVAGGHQNKLSGGER